MNLYHIDLEKEFQKAKKNKVESNLLQELKKVLNDAYLEDVAIEKRIFGQGNKQSINWNQLDEKRIFSQDEIRSICIKYRLRFLDSTIFKGEIPVEAIAKVKQLEKSLGIPLCNYKIVAPRDMFKLQDKNSDPILFLKLSENLYYMVHKWGGEINSLRLLTAFPMRSITHFLAVLISFSIVIALIIPTASLENTLFIWISAFIFMCGACCLILFSLHENFSFIEWDSKYLS